MSAPGWKCVGTCVGVMEWLTDGIQSGRLHWRRIAGGKPPQNGAKILFAKEMKPYSAVWLAEWREDGRVAPNDATHWMPLS